MDRRINVLRIGLALISIGFFLLLLSIVAGPVNAAPKTDQIKQMWEGQYRASVLDIQYKGGERGTNQLHNKHYITQIGTCWDYDVVELQKCGCRQFSKASVCCRKGSGSDCEIRIGNSTLVDCAKYGKAKYGRSGDTEPPECKQNRNQSECFKNSRSHTFGPGYVIGNCKGVPYFTCPKGQETLNEFYKNKCGPTPEDCGCKIVEECSEEKYLNCYNEWKKGKTGQSSLPVPSAANPAPQSTQTQEVPMESTVNRMKNIFR